MLQLSEAITAIFIDVKHRSLWSLSLQVIQIGQDRIEGNIRNSVLERDEQQSKLYLFL